MGGGAVSDGAENRLRGGVRRDRGAALCTVFRADAGTDGLLLAISVSAHRSCVFASVTREYCWRHDEKGNRMKLYRTLGLIVVALLSTVICGQNPQNSLPVLNVSSMDKSMDPCVDFFEYSCGGWIKKNPIPPDQTSWSVYSKLEDDNKLILRNILESAAKANASRDATNQKIGDYYAACMDKSAIEKAGITPLQPELERIENLKSKAELASLVVSMQPAKENYLRQETVLFDFGSSQDFKDSTQVIATADQGGLGLPDRDYYLKG